MYDFDEVFKIIKSGVHEIVSEDELLYLISSKKDLVIKVGFDPTTSALHLGHVVILKKLRDFQKLGYKICFLIGDFTAMIGDPSGRSNCRKQINKDDVMNNYKTYTEQIFKILDPNLTCVYFNSVWFDECCLDSFIKLLSFTTVSRLLERSDFKLRYKECKPIGLHEFIYPLLQAYDSVFVKADIEIGGIDQKFNLLLGREIQKRFGEKPQVLIMMPILNGLDGKSKMSKSLGNSVNITDDFYDVFCKIMSIPDVLMEEYFLFLGFLSANEYKDFFLKNENPMSVKLDLAYRIVSLIHNESLADKAKNMFINHFSQKTFSDGVEVISLDIKCDFISLYDVLSSIKFLDSYSDFKRLLKQGAVKVDKIAIYERLFSLSSGKSYFLQVGKKKFAEIFLKKV